MEDLFEIGKAV